MEFLEVQNLCKTYGKGDNQVTALDHVSRSFFADIPFPDSRYPHQQRTILDTR